MTGWLLVVGAAGFAVAATVLFSLIGFLRRVFVVPALAAGYTAGDPTTKATSWPPRSPTSPSGIWADCWAAPCGGCGCSP